MKLRRSPRVVSIKLRCGVTLVEVSISTLFVGFLMVAALLSVGNITKTWGVTGQVADGHELAKQLLVEIVSQNYSDPSSTARTTWGPESGESSRTQFNDVDDYVGWSENPVKSANGTAISGYAGWSRSVTIEKLSSTYAAVNSTSTDTGLRAITVSVTAPNGKVTTVKALRTDAAGTLQPISADATLVTWVGCTLKVGTNTANVSGVNLTNHAEDQ